MAKKIDAVYADAHTKACVAAPGADDATTSIGMGVDAGLVAVQVYRGTVAPEAFARELIESDFILKHFTEPMCVEVVVGALRGLLAKSV